MCILCICQILYSNFLFIESRSSASSLNCSNSAAAISKRLSQNEQRPSLPKYTSATISTKKQQQHHNNNNSIGGGSSSNAGAGIIGGGGGGGGVGAINNNKLSNNSNNDKVIQLDNNTKAYQRINLSHSDENNECKCSSTISSSISIKQQPSICQNTSKIYNSNNNHNQTIKQKNYRQLSFGELETIISQQTLANALTITAPTKIPNLRKSDAIKLDQNVPKKPGLQQLRRSQTTNIEVNKEPSQNISKDLKVGTLGGLNSCL